MAGNYWWLLILLLGAILFVIARRSTVASDQSGGPVPSQKKPDSRPAIEYSTIRVATYNIQGGKNLSGERDIRRAAKALAGVDLAGVQEVHAATWPNRLGLGASQTEWLSRDSGAAGIFCATRRRWFREHRGNALLSKLPIESWRKIMLPHHSGHSYRNMTIAKVLWQGEYFHFINTHLHTRQGRDQQLAIVLAEMARYPRAILVGDFNCSAESPLLAQALGQAELKDAIALARLDQPDERRIDWILCKGFRVLEGTRIEKGISDHPGYLVTLAFT